MIKEYIKYIFALILFGSNGLVAGLITLSSTIFLTFSTCLYIAGNSIQVSQYRTMSICIPSSIM